MSTPVDDFFVRYVSLGFRYRKNRTSHNNFNRLCKVFGWEEGSTEFFLAKDGFDDALVQQFYFIYGTENSLEAWQNLCEVIDITPVPDDIKECQKHVWDAHVNIVDLIEAGRTGKRVQKFATLELLRAYTLSTKKIFPKKKAYAEGLLKELLREIINPYYGRRRNGSEKRKRRKARKQAAATNSSP